MVQNERREGGEREGEGGREREEGGEREKKGDFCCSRQCVYLLPNLNSTYVKVVTSNLIVVKICVALIALATFLLSTGGNI
jgi:hypothetical protein